MQTIKEVVDGAVHYRKPSQKKGEGKYKRLRSYSNGWYFAQPGKNLCDVIWKIGQDYYLSLQDAKARPHHVNKHPVQLVKYFYFLYLTGSRLYEPFHKPHPVIEIINSNGYTWLNVTKVNEKHFRNAGERETITETLPVFCPAEQAMWNFVTDGGLYTHAAEIFKFDAWRSIKKVNVSRLVKRNFRTDLKDELGSLHKEHGITPHILRHARAYNVLIDHGMKDERETVVKWFGWRGDSMLFHYVDLQRALSIGKQLDSLKRANVLTELRIDAGVHLG